MTEDTDTTDETLDLQVNAYPQPDTAPDDTPEAPADELSPEIITMIAEAEHRGYLRGRNEAIAERMRSPALLQNPARMAADSPSSGANTDDDPYSSLFLSRLRPGVWD